MIESVQAEFTRVEVVFLERREQIRKRHRAKKRRFWLTVFLLATLIFLACYQCARKDAPAVTAPLLQMDLPIPTPEPYMEYGTETGAEIDASSFTDPSSKNNRDLVSFALEAWEHQWGYVWGMFGDILTEEWLIFKLEQYPEDVGKQEYLIREKWMGRRTTDCVGLIKAYGWFAPSTGTITYNSGTMPDCSTETMFEAATEKGTLDTIPELPGVIVYREGHVGIYMGNDFVIEAKGTEYGVVKTKLSESDFTHWFKCPYIEYSE